MNSFTKDLISWIENNLDNNIFLDKVSEKSGYSKWHLQRIFKAETKINLASYVRQRRLSKAAIMLKMTSVLVCDISDYLGFSTQQTFTRTFTRHFGIAPGKYRMQEDWHFQGITSDLRLEKKSDLVPELVFLGTSNLSGIVLTYLCDCGDLADAQFHTTQRHAALKQANRIFGCSAHIIAEYCIPASLSENIKFNLILAPQEETSSFYKTINIHCNGGKFLRFGFEGTQSQLTEMQIEIYHNLMPHRPESLRKGYDFFISNPNNKYSDTSLIEGDYYVPVS